VEAEKSVNDARCWDLAGEALARQRESKPCGEQAGDKKKIAGKPVDRKEKIDGVSTSSDRTPSYGHASSLVENQLHRLTASSDQETNREHRLGTNTRPTRSGA
jgi:hypothetical protein